MQGQIKYKCLYFCLSTSTTLVCPVLNGSDTVSLKGYWSFPRPWVVHGLCPLIYLLVLDAF